VGDGPAAATGLEEAANQGSAATGCRAVATKFLC
jgi:hypothetical protein